MNALKRTIKIVAEWCSSCGWWTSGCPHQQ